MGVRWMAIGQEAEEEEGDSEGEVMENKDELRRTGMTYTI